MQLSKTWWCRCFDNKHYQKTLIRRVPESLPCPFFRAHGKQMICRASARKHTANTKHTANRALRRVSARRYTVNRALHRMYTEARRQVHGPDWDPSAHDLDRELIMKVGGGKKHGQYFIGEGTLDTTSTPTLSQIRARTTDSGLPIRPRQSVAELRVQKLEVNLGLFIVHSIWI